MKKYIIFSIPRTESTYYANLIDTYHRHTLANYSTDLYYSSHDKVADWTHAVQHTHQIDLFATAPDEFIKILPTRCLLDSAVSSMVAEHTGIWHVFCRSDRSGYIDQLQNRKIHIDIDQFRMLVHAYDDLYTKALEIFGRHAGEKYILEYCIHALDYRKFFSTLGTNWSSPNKYPDLDKSYQLPIDKFALVENLDQGLNLYKSMSIKHDFNDHATVAHATTFLRKPI